jgi:DNA-binding NarL/FixJ family response regulator
MNQVVLRRILLIVILAHLLTAGGTWWIASGSHWWLAALVLAVLCGSGTAALLAVRLVDPDDFLRQVQRALESRNIKSERRSREMQHASDRRPAASEPRQATEPSAAPPPAPVTPAVLDERWALLTEREREIVMAVGKGMTNKEIAAHFVVTDHTVKKHLSNVFSKLNFRNRTEVALFALEQDVVPPASALD